MYLRPVPQFIKTPFEQISRNRDTRFRLIVFCSLWNWKLTGLSVQVLSTHESSIAGRSSFAKFCGNTSYNWNIGDLADQTMFLEVYGSRYYLYKPCHWMAVRATDADVSNIFEYARYLNGESIKHFSVTRDGKSSACYIHIRLTLKHREMHGCVVSTVATDALVLKHQAISILSTD